MVDMIDTDSNEDPFCFYQIDLEGALTHEPVWFQNDEVALLDLQGPTHEERVGVAIREDS
jgi:hypothetical protein